MVTIDFRVWELEWLLNVLYSTTQWDYDNGHTNSVLSEVSAERERQEKLKGVKFDHSCADTDWHDTRKLTVLAEEFGEVAHIVCDSIDPDNPINYHKLKEELIQTAAVCVAWIEALEVQYPDL